MYSLLLGPNIENTHWFAGRCEYQKLIMTLVSLISSCHFSSKPSSCQLCDTDHIHGTRRVLAISLAAVDAEVQPVGIWTVSAASYRCIWPRYRHDLSRRLNHASQPYCHLQLLELYLLKAPNSYPALHSCRHLCLYMPLDRFSFLASVYRSPIFFLLAAFLLLQSLFCLVDKPSSFSSLYNVAASSNECRCRSDKV